MVVEWESGGEMWLLPIPLVLKTTGHTLNFGSVQLHASCTPVARSLSHLYFVTLHKMAYSSISTKVPLVFPVKPCVRPCTFYIF
jgi:hypothetical protein